MKVKNSIFVFCFIVLASVAAGQIVDHSSIIIPKAAGIQKISMDGNWQFVVAKDNMMPASSAPEAVDAKAREIAASLHKHQAWASVKVPQFLNRISWWLPDVSLEYEKQEVDRVSRLPEGATTAHAGWYIKNIRLPRESASKEVYVNFEGVALVSRVYINGVNIGGHLGMFGSFKCRLTPFLKPGQDNQLLVYVERGVKSGGDDKIVSVEVSVPVTRNMLLSLNKSMFDKIGPKYHVMGIWLPVTLEVSEAGGRIGDVFFNPRLDGHTMEFTMENPDSSRAVSGKLSYTLTNKKTGKVLVSQVVNPALKLAPGERSVFSISKSGLKPDIWSPDIPNLYIMEVKWTASNGKLIHKWKEQVGFRTVEARGAQVYLNGKPYWSRGANMPPYGYKPNDKEVARSFLKYMHEGNTVITRSHGNPWNHMWFTAADEIGIGVSCESATWALLAKEIPPAGNLAHWKKEQLEIVKQYRNHPSILFYVVSNEGLANDDYKNPEKLAIYRDIITEMRKLDNSRLIYHTSGNPDYLKIADIEDTHSYWDWYMSSSYVNDYTRPGHGLPQNGRPFLSQEVAVPYSMIDDGSVHPSYIPRYCAQPWVGDLGVFGNDRSYFQEHIRAVSKLKAEKLRYSREKLPSAGFMLFCNVTWIRHALSRPVSEWKPFPVYHAVKEAYQPVLVGLTNTQYVFYAGSGLSTELFVVNDDTRRRDFRDLRAVIRFQNSEGKTVSTTGMSVGEVPYYAVKRLPVQLLVPSVSGTTPPGSYEISVALLAEGKEIGRNTYPVRIVEREALATAAGKGKVIGLSGVAPQLARYLKDAGMNVSDVRSLQEKADVLIVGSFDTSITRDQLQSFLKPGGRALVLGQARKAHRFCREVIASYNEATGEIGDNTPNHENTIQMVQGEFVEMLRYDASNPLYKGLQPMDWKWWATGKDKPAFVTIASHKIKTAKDNVIPLGRYLEPHAYWSGNLNEVYGQKLGYPVFAVNYPWGQLVVCDLIIEGAIEYDPRAGQTIMNLLTAEITKK